MSKSFIGIFIAALGAPLVHAQALPPAVSDTRIVDVRRLLETCPDKDPAYSTIRNDFEFRRTGILAPIPACTEPVSAMPVSQITDELVLLQILRIAYYMDRGKTNYLPWTGLRFYDWVKSKIGGINMTNLGTGAGSCCVTFNGKTFININNFDDFNKRLGVQPWGALGLIGLIAHESRHVDGYPHQACGCTNGSCDVAYDETNLSPYAITAYLARQMILLDTIDVGLECDFMGASIQYRASILDNNNNRGRAVFCGATPPPITAPVALDYAKCAARKLTIGTGGVTNGANYDNHSVAYGELLTVFATIDATSTTTYQLTSDGRLSGRVDNTRLLLNGINAPLIYVAPNQISGLAPFDFGSLNNVNGVIGMPVELERNGLISNPIFMGFSQVNPGIFTLTRDGKGPAAAINQNGTFNTATNPAAKGDVVSVYVAGAGGLGTVSTNAYDGLVFGNTPPAMFYKAAITVDGQNAEITYSGQAPQQVAGLTQVNFKIPATVTRTGELPIRISMVAPQGFTAGSMLAGSPTIFVK